MRPSDEVLRELIENITDDIGESDAEIILYSIEEPRRALLLSAFRSEASPVTVAAKLSAAVVIAMAQDLMNVLLPPDELDYAIEQASRGIYQDLQGWIEAIVEKLDPMKDELTNWRN